MADVKAYDASVMVVDDTPENLRLLSAMLGERGCRVRAFTDAEMALRAAQKDPPEIMLVDVNMPGMNGHELCSRLKGIESLKDVPVLFVSAAHETEAKLKAFASGGADYITKPFRFEEVDARIQTHLKLYRLQRSIAEHNRHLEATVAEQVQEISDSQLATIVALARLAEFRDDETGKHIERTRTVSRRLAVALAEVRGTGMIVSLKVINAIYHASPLHDIGKVGIRDAVLLKPGRLTPEEFEEIKTHTTLGAKTLAEVQAVYPNNVFLRVGHEIALCHHERWDGSGYPAGLVASAIPLTARIVSVADVYDALRSKRPYKEAWSHEDACAAIIEGGGGQFDPTVVAAFQLVAPEIETIHERLRD